MGALKVSAFSPNIKFIVASCCSRKQSWGSVHHGAILNPVVVSVSMESFHNHNDSSPGSSRFHAGALCLIPVCEESLFKTKPVTLTSMVAMAATSPQSGGYPGKFPEDEPHGCRSDCGPQQSCSRCASALIYSQSTFIITLS